MDNAPALRQDTPKCRQGSEWRNKRTSNGATSGAAPDQAAPATTGDIAALQHRIEQPGAAVSDATNGLKLYRSEEDVIERIRKRFTYVSSKLNRFAREARSWHFALCSGT